MRTEPEEYEGGGLLLVFLGIVILVWVLRALFTAADQSK